ncbi:glutathione transferase [Penicillium brasilianum]|uniref:Glutathione transferase n=1 Tax=Penicillium brasilianum TaxID=104259 RepID=A0A1S9RZQ7_PENBI|nr:glutathione transferase [Penicillium brasilianum]
MPIVEEASISIPASQANQFSTANPFASFRSIENIPPASQPQQAIASSSQHVAQHQQKSCSSMQRSIQLPGSQFDGSPHDAQMIGMTNNAPESSNVQLALGLQPPSHTTFPEHDYAALVADAPDITNFLDSFPGHLQGMKLVRDPPDLDTWRNILFHVDEMITLSEEQFQIYFPHIDNVYSLRSTQRYKRKPFASHYWDCRLKGRASGTPKSDDPNKKKRKRVARERDLCDVKIKITEYFPTAGVLEDVTIPEDMLPDMHSMFPLQGSNAFSVLSAPSSNLPGDHPGATGKRYFTIQRVNGTGAQGQGLGCGHQHTIEDSDRVKKNSVQRILLKEDKERKKNTQNRNMSDQKSYHTKATGLAAVTAAQHTAESRLKLYGSCFCPFVQRVWIALEMKKIPYQYIEVDPYQKPQSLLEVNPRGLVPALRHDDWGCYESTVLMEYLEDLNLGTALLPEDARIRAHCRVWADHINRSIVPGFYRVLQEQNPEKQLENAKELRGAFDKLLAAAHPQGPFFMGSHMSFVDVQVAPWVIRLRRVLKPYRGWPDTEEGTRWASWVNAIDSNEYVRATTSSDELYLDSYARYAENRPNTSQVANAINSGRGLP